MTRSKKQAIGRINPKTGELEFQGANKAWLPSGMRLEVDEIKHGQTAPIARAKPNEPSENMIQDAMMGLCAMRAGDE